MLSSDAIETAETIYRNRPYRTTEEFVSAVMVAGERLGLHTPERCEDRSEFASRCGYACVPGASKMVQH